MPIISTIDEEALINQGLLSPANSDGVRRIHKRRLNKSSDEEYQHLPLSPVSVASSSHSELEIYSMIPVELISLATIKYLGYDHETATQIWNKWTAQAPGDPVPESVPIDPFSQFDLRFIDNVVGHSYGFHHDFDINAHGDDDTKWYECMNRFGINDDTQAAIMDPVFRRIRLTESCIYWIRNTVELRYEALESIQEASLEREHAIWQASRPAGNTSQQMSSSSSISGTTQRTPGISQDTAMSEAALRAANTPGTITIYKGIGKSRINKLFDNNGNLDNIETLLSTSPTDFCGRESVYSFAIDRDIAIHYALFSRRRSNESSIVMVHATIQNSAIEILPEGELQQTYWPSEEWKRLIFFSRKAKKLPSDLVKFKQASLIIGTIATKPNMVYVNMKDHSEITERMVLKNEAGRNAVQYVFREEGEEILTEKTKLEVYPITATEFRQWHANMFKLLEESSGTRRKEQ